MAAKTPDAYEDLLETYERISNLYTSQRVLRWDQEVMMPEGGTPARSKQLSTLSSLEHELLTGESMAETLSALESTSLDEGKQAVVREIRRLHERKRAVPEDLIEAIAETSSNALPIWREAKAQDDFDRFAPTLESLVSLKREYAHHVDPDRDPYAVLFEEYEPYLGLETAERILSELKSGLVPRIDAIRERDVENADPVETTVDAEDLEDVSREILTLLGYDWNRGRLDTAPHPFSTGTQFDARISTRYDESDPLSSIFSTIHEFGHARYTQGLPEEAYGTPLGEAMAMTVHESQSRLWENHVGRSRDFLSAVKPILAEQVPAFDSVSVDALYRATNRVDPDTLIRVNADELTYHLHIVLRYEIERDLVRGDLAVEEVPGVWNDKMESYLGVRPETDTKGCLQDIHWSHGDFGYFPTYSLGSVLAAQLFAAAEREIDDLSGSIQDGDVAPLANWLEDTVHRHGKRYRTGELIERATGEALTTDYFLEYVAGKFDDRYHL
ncbi:MAG: carboxypeptidase M32 [Halodesulfurarchaeum sp.]